MLIVVAMVEVVMVTVAVMIMMTGTAMAMAMTAAGYMVMGMGMQRPGTKTGMGPIIFQFMGLIGDKQFPKAGIFKKGMISN
jgi:hypothetical protein